MFEKKLEELSEKLGGEKKKFYLISHKRRETYFQKNGLAIDFLKVKFRPYPNNPKDSGFLKKIAYALLRMRVLPVFMKTIQLSSELGDVIFAGGQIKSFDLGANVVTSFPLEGQKDFIASKKYQEKLGEKGFAPEIFEINEKIPFSREELLPEYNWDNDLKVFEKLLSFYETSKVKTVSLKTYLSFLDKEIKRKGKENSLLYELLEMVLSKYPSEKMLKTVVIHGDFAREQILIKGDDFVFTDWNSERNLITSDLAMKFFRGEVNILENKKFREILGLYPKDVQENIDLYVVLNELYSMIRGRISASSVERIKNILIK